MATRRSDITAVLARVGTAILLATALAVVGQAAAHAAPGTATITGEVSREGGVPLQSEYSAYVSACPLDGGACVTAGAANSEPRTYSLDVPAPGEYIVCLEGGAFTDLLGECANDGEPVALADGETFDLDWEVVVGGHLSGTVSYYSPTLGELDGANGTTVSLFRLDEAGEYFEWYAETQVPAGYPSFDFSALPPGSYAVHFFAPSAFQNELLLNSEYWVDARYWAERTDLEVAAGDRIDLGDIVLQPRTIDSFRLSGASRYETGVAISQAAFPDVPPGGVPVVYVANGGNYPDALAAGPAAIAQGGALLLVEAGRIPPAVADELERLDPQRIVVAGGSGTVGNAVFTALRGFVDHPGDLVRLGGSDRYETARLIVRDAFEGESTGMAFIATGSNFPDALSAGPAAGSVGAPVILIDGRGLELDEATRDLLADLDVTTAFLAGGTGTITAHMEDLIRSVTGPLSTVRFAGENRYETALLINQSFFTSSEYVLVANAGNFPDALAGGPLAGGFGAPLYLAPADCLPVDIVLEILALDAQGMILLGGPGALSTDLESFTTC